jgi:hypothetical protein
MTTRQSELAERIDAHLATAGCALSVQVLASALNLPAQAIDALFSLNETRTILVKSGSMVHSVNSLRVTSNSLFDKFGFEPFPPRAFREHLGLTRSEAERLVEMLEAASLMERKPGGWRLLDIRSSVNSGE